MSIGEDEGRNVSMALTLAEMNIESQMKVVSSVISEFSYPSLIDKDSLFLWFLLE